MPGDFAYYCTLHGTPGKGQHANLAVGDDVGASDGRPRSAASDAPAPTIAASGRTIRVPADAKTVQAGVDRARPGDLVLVSPGVYREEVTVATDGIVLRGVDRNRTILDGEFKRDNGVKVVGADGVAIENLTTRNFTENGFFWNGVLGYRGVVPHRVPQRRLRRLRVRLAVGPVRPLVRVGEPRFRLLHRSVQSVPRGDHRRDRRVQPTRATRGRTRAVISSSCARSGATTAPASCRTASTAKRSRRRAMPSSPAI